MTRDLDVEHCTRVERGDRLAGGPAFGHHDAAVDEDPIESDFF